MDVCAPWRLSCLALAAGCLSGALLQGCGALGQTPAVQLMGQVAATGLPAYLRETDLLLAEPALAASLKMTEALLETAPHDPRLLLQATQGFAGYTYAFVEGRLEESRGHDAAQVQVQTQRARQLYQRGLHYGLRLLGHYRPALAQAPTLPLATLTEQLQHLPREAVPALLWTGFCWGGWLNSDRTALDTLAAVPLFQALLHRLLALDETYFYGFPHLLQALQAASFSRALGGNPEDAPRHFARAQALSQGRMLLVPLLEAQYYAVQIQDRRLFRERLQQVLDAPETLFPEQGLLNAVARRRAALLLQRIEALFL
ncbi:MAG: TRAP transporter TatT component family protein [Candidatus Tectimicrobiota bacterium]